MAQMGLLAEEASTTRPLAAAAAAVASPSKTAVVLQVVDLEVPAVRPRFALVGWERL